MRRSDDVPSEFERRDERLFRDRGKWFYHIRDGLRGPFANRQEAQDDMQRFVVTRSYMETHPNAPKDLNIDDVTHIELKAPQY
ncbi:MAG: DUF6316 family protein [Pseudomonadales bacterium]